MIGLYHSAAGVSLFLISTMCMNCILIEFRPGMGISLEIFSLFLLFSALNWSAVLIEQTSFTVFLYTREVEMLKR